jgi:hypothetical protein
VQYEAGDLRTHLGNANDELEELRDEVAGLRRELADQADQSVSGSVAGDRSRGVIRREVEKLEQVSFLHLSSSLDRADSNCNPSSGQCYVTISTHRSVDDAFDSERRERRFERTS